jgi:hypothetical protein
MSEEIRRPPWNDRMISRSSEDFTIQLIIAIAIFVPLGFAARFFAYYFVGSGSFASFVYAFVGILLSVIIFFSLSYYIGLLKVLASGFLINAMLLLFLHLFLWVPNSLTIRYFGSFLFLDGYATIQGFVYYLPLALLESAISCLDFMIYWKLSKRIMGGHQ